MEDRKKQMENTAREAVQKASDAVKNANEALEEANSALKAMQELSDDELGKISGAGDNLFESIPRVKMKQISDTVREYGIHK